MKKFFYDSLDDSNRRVGQSLITGRKDKDSPFEPCWVNSVVGLNRDQQAEVSFTPWGRDGAERTILPFTRDFFEIHRLPSLGYVDFKDYSWYLTRRPIRGGKQGIDRRNIHIPQVATLTAPGFDALLGSKVFNNCLKGIYDPFEKVYDKVVSSPEPVKKSFQKTFAVSIDDVESVSLWYRGLRVGVANNPKRYGPTFLITKKFSFLKEELEEHKIKVEF